MTYKFLEHTADIKFVVRNKNLKGLFLDATEAILFIIKENKVIKGNIRIPIKIEENNIEKLLHSFLEEIIFLLDSENFILSKIEKLEINEENFSLSCVFVGDNILNYEISNGIKAITYNNLSLEHDKDWSFECVIDI